MYDLLLVASVILLVGVGLFYFRQPCAAIFHPATFYFIFHGFVFVFRPIIARLYDFQLIYQIGEFQPSWDDKITVLLAANLGFLTFMGVSMLVANQPWDIRRDVFEQIHREKLIKPFLIVFTLLVPPALFSLFHQWSLRADDWSTMAFDAATGITYNLSGNGWFYTLEMTLVPLTVIFAWIFRFRWWSLIPFATYFFLRAGTGGRGAFVVAAIAIVLLFLIDRRRRWPDWRSVVLFGMTAVAFVLVVADRGQAIRTVFVDEDVVVYRADYSVQPLEHMDFANLEYFEFIVYAVPQRSGTYDYFLQNLQVFTEAIPRTWWADKPVGPPIQLFSLFDYGDPTGFTYSVPGAGWLSLGYLGVIIQAAVFALGYGYLYRSLLRSEWQGNFALLVYVLMVSATIITYRDGTLLTVLRQMPFYIGPIGLVWLLARIFGMPGAAQIRQTAHARISGGKEQAADLLAGKNPVISPRERRRRLAQASG